MFLTWEARRPCVLCGYQLRAWLFDTFRINKRSLRATGTGATMAAWHRACPECGTPAPDAPRRETYTLTPDSAEQVRAYRLRRWPELAAEVA